MDSIPSKSISKSLLIATPLFLIIMAVLNTSNQISYLFVLDFVNNIGGKADIMFLPTLQPQLHTTDPYHELMMMSSNLNTKNNRTSTIMQGARIPLINMSHVSEWQERNQLVKGTAPRWLFPVVSDKTSIDSLVMVMNISLQNSIGSSTQANLQPLNQNQIAIPQQLFNRLNTPIGSNLQITMGIKNLFNGMKLIQKFQDPTSSDQFTTQTPELNISQTIQKLYQQLDKSYNISQQITQEKFQQAILTLYNAQLKKQFKIKYIYKESGLYPSALHNVILMEYQGFAGLLWEFLKDQIILSDQINITQYIPKEYQSLWKLTTKSTLYDSQAKQQLSQLLQDYCVIAISLMNSRQLLYHPNRPLKEQFSRMLQKSPENVEVVALYPFYQQSLNIKYFFGSVIQIFQVVTCVIYFFTMLLIMKQIYQEKEIEVGIWRTLGAGGVRQKSVDQLKNESRLEYNQELHANNSPAVYKLNQQLSIIQKIRHYFKIMVKIGFLYYWLASSLLSILLYMLIKYFLIKFICGLLYFDELQQNYFSALWLFIGVFGLSQFFVISHIRDIYIAPLSLTIKPLKRTFDQVKIRVIHLSTFGISSQTLLIALMLIYYGVVSYYWIPFSIQDNDGDLQVLLFNSIFIFMIFGAIILIAVLQSRLQRLILRVFASLSERLSKIKSIMLKNIKAKQYKNIKMSIIIAVTFAFLLFFSTGINIEIMIVESFLQRQLGAELVLQNYEKKSFDQQKVETYLKALPDIKYSWISSDINSDDIKLQLVNQMDPIRKIYCQWKVMTANYLDSAFYQYYYPQNYMLENISSYRVLGNGVINGFDSLYKYDKKFNNQSIGRFDESDTMTEFDPNRINIYQDSQIVEDMMTFNDMAPDQQVINFAASSLLKLQMGSNVGDLYKLRITSKNIPYYLNVRSRIVHSYKVGPGMDLLRPQAFITEQQAKYLLNALGHNETIRYEKLLISGPQDQLKQIGNKILAMSPEHTQMFQMKIVAESFQLLQKYLSFYIVLIATIMGTLAVLFVFLYTLGKCKDQAEMYKMLRAIGVSVTDLRIMIFLEILIRLFVSITNGILLGIVFSLGFGMQIEEFLMINTPGMDLSLILTIAAIMLAVFCLTVYLATRYLTKKTVADTAKN